MILRSINYYYLRQLLLLVILLPYSLCAQIKNDSTQKNNPHLGFFDLNVGTDVKDGHGLSPENTYYRWGWGVSARMQNSFVANYIYNPAKKYRIRIGDFMAAELGTGLATGQGYGSYHTALLLEYSFEFGIMGIMRLNDNNELGVTITALQFARDHITPNISGSNLLLRYRFRRLVAQAGIEGRRDRVVGWLTTFSADNNIPTQYIGELRYLLSSTKNIGIRTELLANKNSRYIADGILLQTALSIRIFYGIYF